MTNHQAFECPPSVRVTTWALLRSEALVKHLLLQLIESGLANEAVTSTIKQHRTLLSQLRLALASAPDKELAERIWLERFPR